MKKYIARNAETGDKVFCKYELTKTGLLMVEYYLPKYGYSVIWDRKNNYCRIAGNRYSVDGRKSIVTYHIHPSYWSGVDFKHTYYFTIFDAMNMCFKENINLHI